MEGFGFRFRKIAEKKNTNNNNRAKSSTLIKLQYDIPRNLC